MTIAQLEQAPGFRRRIKVTPTAGHVLSEVEDDYHRMSVSLYHDDSVVHTVKAELLRAPWSTCPGAVDKCEDTFTGVALQDFSARRDKAANCTHLFDLALLAAAHALDDVPLLYDCFVSDPINGRRHAEIFRNGEPVLDWFDANYTVVEPAAMAGLNLQDMRTWIDSLEPMLREAARVLRWVSLIAHGRTIPMEKQSDATRMPSSCYTFQPERKSLAQRIGKIRDFSDGTVQPLENHGDSL